MKFLLIIFSLLITFGFNGQGVVTIVSDSIHDETGLYQYTDMYIITAGCASSLTLDEDICAIAEGSVELNLYDDMGNSNLIEVETIDQVISQEINCEPADEVRTFTCPSSFPELFINFSCFPETVTQSGKIIVTTNIQESISGNYCGPHSYLWTGPSISGMIDQSLYSTVNGVHIFSVTNNEGVYSDYEINLYPSDTPYQYHHEYSCDGLVEINSYEQNPILVFPNPASSDLFLKNVLSDVLVTIFNSNGKSILTENINGDQPINIESLVAGVYFIVIDDLKGNRNTNKILVQH